MTVKPYVFVILILLSYTLFGFPFLWGIFPYHIALLFTSVLLIFLVLSPQPSIYNYITLNSSQNPGWVVYSILGGLIPEGGDGVSGAERGAMGVHSTPASSPGPDREAPGR